MSECDQRGHATELQEAVAMVGRDRAVRALVLTGAGRGFCAGLDLRSFGPSMPDAVDPAIDVLRFQEMMASLPQTYARCLSR